MVETADGLASVPELSVVVPSHGRRARLPALLDALAQQTLDGPRWEVLVVHSYDDAALAAHRLARDGALRSIRIEPGLARASRQRNLGWRAARGRLIAFTDDDCRPAPDWLERLIERFEEYPGAIVQGATRPDPRDEAAFAAPHIRTVWANPPHRDTQTCNILYERALLERLGGFDEASITGEDIELARRAVAAGAVLVGAPDAIVYHAIEALGMRAKMGANRKWEHLVYLVRTHPELRRELVLWTWWKREHLGAAIALAALAAAPRRPWMLAGVWPYYMSERKRHGPTRKQKLRAIREMPEHWLIELAEIWTFLRGSARYRKLVV